MRVATVKGKYKSGQAAAALLQDGGGTHTLAVDSDATLVVVQLVGSLGKTLANVPMPLKEVLSFLESNGKVRPTMVGHKIVAKSDGSGWDITVDDTVAMQVKSETSGKRLTVENISGLVVIDFVRDSNWIHIVPTWQYHVKKNKFIPSYPTVWLKQPTTIKKDKLYKISAGK